MEAGRLDVEVSQLDPFAFAVDARLPGNHQPFVRPQLLRLGRGDHHDLVSPPATVFLATFEFPFRVALRLAEFAPGLAFESRARRRLRHGDAGSLNLFNVAAAALDQR